MGLIYVVLVQDFTEMMVHHFVCITLMVFSWCNNMVRIGGLVLLCHDAVDYLMEVSMNVDCFSFFKDCLYCGTANKTGIKLEMC